MEGKEVLQEWVENTVRLIATEPDQVSVEVKEDEQGVLFTVKPGKKDTGLFIGKKGQSAKAFRDLLHLIGIGQDVRASLLIWTEEGPRSKE